MHCTMCDRSKHGHCRASLVCGKGVSEGVDAPERCLEGTESGEEVGVHVHVLKRKSTTSVNTVKVIGIAERAIIKVDQAVPLTATRVCVQVRNAEMPTAPKAHRALEEA